jgi:hypothetical protein
MWGNSGLAEEQLASQEGLCSLWLRLISFSCFTGDSILSMQCDFLTTESLIWCLMFRILLCVTQT